MTSEPTTTVSAAAGADVEAVSVSGSEDAYNFSVTLRSPDTGCDQFADWWEVLSEDGALLHRRVLLHSHVDEQPFTRGSGPIAVAADDVVLVRAHMSNTGYGGVVFRGTPAGGFEAAEEIGPGLRARRGNRTTAPDRLRVLEPLLGRGRDVNSRFGEEALGEVDRLEVLREPGVRDAGITRQTGE